MQNRIIKKISTLIILTSFMFMPFSAANAAENFASFSLVPDKNTFLNPEIITFDLKLDYASSTINAIDARLKFDTKYIELLSVNASSSLCSLFINETIDNENGRYQMICGTEKKDLTENKIITLTFKKIKSGLTTITTSSDSQVLLGDGLGTNLTVLGETHNIFIF